VSHFRRAETPQSYAGVTGLSTSSTHLRVKWTAIIFLMRRLIQWSVLPSGLWSASPKITVREYHSSFAAELGWTESWRL